MATEAFMKLPEGKRNALVSAGMTEFSKKSYVDASTDAITKACGISKGLLFHYFGSKKAFYLHCLDAAMAALVSDTSKPDADDFYGILFFVLGEKLRLCREYMTETRLVNMASRDACAEVAEEKAAVFAKYSRITAEESFGVMKTALSRLRLKTKDTDAALSALRLYVSALINRYLILYRETPDVFFENEGAITAELRRDIDFMLYGICEEDLT